MKKEEIIKNISLFRDRAFSHHSHYKAGQIWRIIKDHIHQPYAQRIAIEWSHIQLGHGYKQACAALDEEVKRYVEFLQTQ